ncbi:MAG: hypothetical protein EZS28_050215, partial [Streblomastix strix]
MKITQGKQPHGSGKKMMADALATEGHTYIIISKKMIEQVERGTCVEKIASFFEQANVLPRCLLIIKNVEEMVQEDNPERDLIIDELDYQLSNKASGAIVIMTSENIEIVPEKIKKHIKKIVFFNLPDENDRRKFFERFSFFDLAQIGRIEGETTI